jgi:amino acid transporter
MFLRFGYAVAHTGMLGALLIVLVGHAVVPLVSGLADPDAFMLVFAVVFPAFTGMTAGVGLSRDLANQRRSIPLGLFCAPA